MITVTKPTRLGDLCTPKHEPLKVGDVIEHNGDGMKLTIVSDGNDGSWRLLDERHEVRSLRVYPHKGVLSVEAFKGWHERGITDWSRNGVPLSEIYAPAQEPTLEAGMRLRDPKGDEWLIVIGRADSRNLVNITKAFSWHVECGDVANCNKAVGIGPDWRDWLLLPNEDKREPKWEWYDAEWAICRYGDYAIFAGRDGEYFNAKHIKCEGYIARDLYSLKAAKLACEDHAEGKGE